MITTAPLEYDSYFHIYNRGINGNKLFWETGNYEHFLHLYDKYINHVAETFAWVLMGNHFHLLIRIKAEDEIGFITPNENNIQVKYSEKKKYIPTKQFSHLFNAYTKAVNKRYGRTGGLFETPFRRIKITDDCYFKRLVFYIHNNPVHHGFVDDMIEYPWSSYLTLITEKPTKLSRKTTLEWFNSKQEFEEFHKINQEFNDLSSFLLED